LKEAQYDPQETEQRYTYIRQPNYQSGKLTQPKVKVNVDLYSASSWTHL